MPSRFAFFAEPNEIIERFPVEDVTIEYYRAYNIKPTNRVVGIIRNRDTGKNEVVRLRWGYAKDQYKARSETIHETRLFAKAFKERRCLILANGFFEWKKVGGKSIPYYFKMKNDDLFSFAGVYNQYADKEDENKIKYKYAVLTIEPNPLVGEIFHRMPVILKPNTEKIWLDPNSDMELVKSVMQTYDDKSMERYQVEELPARKDNGPATIKPLDAMRGSLDDFF